MCVCVFIFALRKHLEENTIKRALQYVRWLSTSTFPSPHWRQRHKSQNDHYSKESSISCQRSAARRSKGANPEDDTLQWRHDNTPYAPSSFGRRQISRWRHRWSKRIRGGDRFLSSFSTFLRCLYVHYSSLPWGTHLELPVYHGTAACATMGNFLCSLRGMSMCMEYSTVHDLPHSSTMSVCVRWLLYQIHQACCVRIVNPGRRRSSRMRYPLRYPRLS